jgi:hypothetical protein
MAKAKSVKLAKKSGKQAVAPKKAAGPVTDFVFMDNQDDTCTVNGVDAAGNPVDISSVATIAVNSGDTTTVTVDPPTGMTFAMHATGKLTASGSPCLISVTATWNDGSVGPFSFTLPVDVVAGPATGVVIIPGTPTSH